MNVQEIYQKRIEEKSKELGQMFFPDNMNPWARPNWEAGYVETACKEVSNFILSNQWISVEEALPDMIDEDMEWSDIVLIKCKYCEDMKPCIMTSRYDVGTGFWLNPVAREITHWMPIPQLKGGEE